MKDHRQACKYWDKCFQKNVMHREKFKHPDIVEGSGDKENVASNKRPLLSDSASDEEEKKKPRVEERNPNYDAETDDASTGDETDSPKIVTKDEKTDSKAEKDALHSKSNDDTQTETVCEPVEYDDILPPSPQNIRENIKQKFLVEMPEDFYQFFEFCKGMNSSDPCNALSSAGLMLCGPYHLLAGKISADKPRSASLYLRHYRYYYDPPEFQTVITTTDASNSDSTLLHIGYFRDSPNEPPVFLASNSAGEGPRITPLADNIFGAVYQFLTKKMADSDPFKRSKLSGVQEKVKLYANRLIINSDDRVMSLEAKTASMKLRDRKKVSTTFHGAGLVVPYDKNTDVGYREIPETTASLKKIFRNIVEAETEDEKNKALDVLQELVTNVQFANDEGDPGMGLELGLDAFSFGGESLHNTIRHLLGVGYELLDRDQFATILTSHLDHRVKGAKVDMFGVC